jgi:hypothetical protein
MGSTLSKPKMRTLPPKKRPEGVTTGCRKSTRVSRKILGPTIVEEEDTGSEQEASDEQLVENSETGREQDDVMIDIEAEPEGVEPPLLDTEQNWIGFDISHFPFLDQDGR